MNASRREFLGTALAVGTAGLAGCSSLTGSRPDLVLSVENRRSSDVRLLLQVIEEDAEDYGDALVYSQTVTVPAGATGDDRWRESGVAPARRYRVRVGVGIEVSTFHYHYIPDCLGDDASYEPQVNVLVNDRPGVTFSQSSCGEKIDWGP